jgi:hypothetical protein
MVTRFPAGDNQELDSEGLLKAIDAAFFCAMNALGGRVILSRMTVYRRYFDLCFDIFLGNAEISTVTCSLRGQVQILSNSQAPATYIGSIHPAFQSCGWRIEGLLGEPDTEPEGSLELILTDGRSAKLEIADLFASYPDQYNNTVRDLWLLIRDGTPRKLLELGGRGGTSSNFQASLPANIQYDSLDIKPGEGVNHVGDAHELSSIVEPSGYDIVYSSSVFEHLAQPWLVAIETNKALKLGGYIFVDAPNAWPLHETPWDFWRYTEFGWASLFNAGTGFEIVSVNSYDEAAILPLVMKPGRLFIYKENGGWLGTACLARKIGEAQVAWNHNLIAGKEVLYPD